jgi:hypothetical protein
LGIARVSAQDDSAKVAALTHQINVAFGGSTAFEGGRLGVDDSVFARRVALDLTGMPLSTARLQSFLDDKAPDKRAKLVDELLAAPQATRHLATWLSLTLLERRAPKISTDELWMAYLTDMVRHDKPLTALTRDLLTADAAEGPQRPAARFLMDRDAEPNLMTRDFGRIFLGRDMQCNQCHDHPLVDGYLQSDYAGLLAFFTPTTVAPIKKGAVTENLLSEKHGGRVLFDSVFVKDDALLTDPGLPGHARLAESAVTPGDEYVTRPTETATSKPKVSRRALLAESLLASPEFRRNWANRIWALAFGRGVVHPLDMNHPENPAANPEMLEVLASGFQDNGFRLKPVLKAAVLSQPYARPFDLPADAMSSPAPGDLAESQSKHDRAKTELEAAEKLFGETKAAWHKALAAVVPVQKKRDPIQAKLDEFGGKYDAARLRIESITARLAQIETQKPVLAEAKTAADKALATIAGDKALEAAAKTYSDKIAAIDAEKVALTDEQGKKAVERRSAEEQLAAYRVQAKAVDSEMAPMLAGIAPLEEAFRIARKRMDDLVEETARTKADIRWHELRAKFAATRVVRKTTIDALAKLEPVSAEAKAAFDAVDARFGGLAKRTAALAAEATEKADRLDKTRKQRDASTGAIAFLDRALSETQSAAALADGAELGQVLSQLQAQKAKLASLVESKKQVIGTLEAELSALTESKTKLQAEAKAAEADRTALAGKSDTLSKDLAGLRDRLAEAVRVESELTEELVETATQRFELSSLKPLSPEALAWSILKATTVYDRYWATAESELDKASPPTEAQKADPAWRTERAYAIEAKVYAQLKSYPNHFANLYGAGAGQPQSDFFATADQALYLANGGAVASWCMPASGNPAEGIIKADTPEKAAHALYFGALGRTPDADEIAVVARALAAGTAETKPTIARDLFWGLLSSPEFRFNH